VVGDVARGDDVDVGRPARHRGVGVAGGAESRRADPGERARRARGPEDVVAVEVGIGDVVPVEIDSPQPRSRPQTGGRRGGRRVVDVAARLEVRADRRRRQGPVVDRDLVRAPARVLAAHRAVAHHVPRHRRDGRPSTRAAVHQHTVEIETGRPVGDSDRKVMPAVAHVDGVQRGRERRAARAVGHPPAAVIGNDPARRRRRIAQHRDAPLPEEPTFNRPRGSNGRVAGLHLIVDPVKAHRRVRIGGQRTARAEPRAAQITPRRGPRPVGRHRPRALAQTPVGLQARRRDDPARVAAALRRRTSRPARRDGQHRRRRRHQPGDAGSQDPVQPLLQGQETPSPGRHRCPSRDPSAMRSQTRVPGWQRRAGNGDYPSSVLSGALTFERT
jgi:hypothetical protein